jgi:catechol 2,3-dioxygenase-like lactoylglutathione lyase family enzyme
MTALALKAHLAINVRNLTTSLNFYRKFFGVEPSKVRTGYAKFDLADPLLNFSLNEQPFNEAGALSHMGIQVRSTADVMSIRQQWHERGLFTRDEMQTDCCYATQDKTWAKDPDGNEWEVFVVLEDNLPEHDQQQTAASCCAPTCCAENLAQAMSAMTANS